MKTTRYFLWQLVRAERVGKRSGDMGGSCGCADSTVFMNHVLDRHLLNQDFFWGGDGYTTPGYSSTAHGEDTCTISTSALNEHSTFFKGALENPDSKLSEILGGSRVES